ncbi:Scr1 family TA system antitoxin-like transcriptional regulator [Streptomyces sp. UNOB3_S3]|uniref:Scr1 family TA system antitoxin-like transcriptional regulator n=1 Tax=Streptomyces sp. UNOB3_S3 TaxID=2871682 RepID=UPI001E4EABD3|nr:Scr1 family TA system antitoxin-like transcriptional regulator [Streptomyces sp. UNOB3_S3]MCC3778681.1 helix-turn-helix domain-containing protein [Streptomyces sp. UNOB3_S3]
MPPRKAPTARQRRVGAELRKMREHAGLTPARAAELLGTDRASISNTEAGRFGVSGERVRTWASHYKCPDAAYVDALAAMAEERVKGWWEDSRGTISTGALDLAEAEYHAQALTSLQVVYIPGLLQTEEYARAVFGQSVPKLAPLDVQRRVSYRMQRKRVTERSPATPCTFLIHEAALRMIFPGVDGQRRQLERLVEASDQDGISIRVITFATGAFPGANSSLTFASGAVPQLDTVALDTAHGSVLLDAQSHLENYRCILKRTLETSLPPRKSRDFINRIAREL